MALFHGKGAFVGLGNIQSAVIMLAVIIIALTVAKEPIIKASENTAKIFGLDIGKPRIGSFTASPTDAGDMQFQLAIAGNKKDVVLEVYQSRASDDTAATELKPPAPKFDPANKVYKICDETAAETGCPKLKDAIVGGVLTVTCPKDYDERGCLRGLAEKYKPDWYWFGAVLKKKGKTVYQSENLVGIYTKSYLEGLDKAVKDCPDCNVKECKRKVLTDSLSTDLAANYGYCLPSVKSIYGRVLDELYPPLQGPAYQLPPKIGCEYPPSGIPMNEKEKAEAFSQCPAEEIGRLHLKASHWLFFKVGCLKSGMSDETVKQVEKLLNFRANDGRTGVAVASGETQEKLAGCLKKAGDALAQRGWSFILTQTDKDKYSILAPANVAITPHIMALADAREETSSYVRNELPPIVTDFTAPSSDGKFYLRWQLPTGSNNMASLLLYHRFGKYIGALDTLPQSIRLPKTATDYVFEPNANLVVGQHEFRIVALADKSDQRSEKVSNPGIYDRGYVESYGQDVKKCQEGELKKKYGLKETTCNVVAKKKAALEGEDVRVKYTWPAYNTFKNKYPSSTCLFIDSKKLVGCTDKELDELFGLMVKLQYGEKNGEDVLNCDNSASYLSVPYFEVCVAKENLLTTMQQMGWGCIGNDCPWPGINICYKIPIPCQPGQPCWKIECPYKVKA